MKKELKEKWIEALRSGDYPQTSNHLCDETGWCCLGVLCDLVDSSKWIYDDSDETEEGAKTYSFGNMHSKEFPSATWLWNVGLNYNLAKKLADMNDDGAFTFEDIANTIQEEVYSDDNEIRH